MFNNLKKFFTLPKEQQDNYRQDAISSNDIDFNETEYNNEIMYNVAVLNDIKEKSDNEEKEIFSDIISLLHCFAMKMYSKRRKNKLKLIEENLEIEQ